MCLSRFKPADWNKFLDVVIKWDIKTMLKMHEMKVTQGHLARKLKLTFYLKIIIHKNISCPRGFGVLGRSEERRVGKECV